MHGILKHIFDILVIHDLTFTMQIDIMVPSKARIEKSSDLVWLFERSHSTISKNKEFRLHSTYIQQTLSKSHLFRSFLTKM